jgi:lipoprotein-releasing system ATP-binding protein
MSDRGDNVLVLKGVRRGFSKARPGWRCCVALADCGAGAGRAGRPSGCGKSTLLHIAGLLEQADSGEI